MFGSNCIKEQIYSRIKHISRKIRARILYELPENCNHFNRIRWWSNSSSTLWAVRGTYSVITSTLNRCTLIFGDNFWRNFIPMCREHLCIGCWLVKDSQGKFPTKPAHKRPLCNLALGTGIWLGCIREVPSVGYILRFPPIRNFQSENPFSYYRTFMIDPTLPWIQKLNSPNLFRRLSSRMVSETLN